MASVLFGWASPGTARLRACFLLIGLTAGIGAAWPGAAASRPTGGSAHGGPPAFVEMRVRSDHLELVLTGEQVLLGEWFGEPGRFDPPLDEARRARLIEGARSRLASVAALRIDDAAVAPAITGLRAYPSTSGVFGLEPSYEFRLRIELAAEPASIDVQWLRFPPEQEDGEGTERQRHITLHVTSLEGVFDLQNLTPEEPRVIWHRPPAPEPIELLPVGLGMEPPSQANGWVALPLGLLGLALLAWMGRRFWRSLPVGTARTGALALWFAGGAVLLVQAQRAFLRPPGPPDEARALELFERLHTNMYRAFDGGSRGAIYDLLAASVDGPILDAMYGDLYEGLILREEGGAVAQVEEVEVLDRELDSALTEQLAGAGFGVVWEWRVRGRVVHFAHEHKRVERLRARYSVRPAEDGWRIAGVEVLAQEREL